MILLQEYTYVRTTSDQRYWHCTYKNTHACCSRLRFDKKQQLVFYDLVHNHAPPPPDFSKPLKGHSSAGLVFEFIKTPKGKKPLLLLEKYTFAQTTNDSRYWNCSKKFGHEKCPARLRFDTTGCLIFYNLNHNHEPPQYFKQKDGHYVKIK